MKRLSFLFALVLIGFSSQSFGQNAPGMPAMDVTLGHILQAIKNGELSASATRAEILAEPELQTPPCPCTITGFTFSMLQKGKNLKGPYTVKGSALSPEILKMIKDMKNPEARIFIDNIVMMAGNQQIKVNPIVIDMTEAKK